MLFRHISVYLTKDIECHVFRQSLILTVVFRDDTDTNVSKEARGKQISTTLCLPCKLRYISEHATDQNGNVHFVDFVTA